MSFIDEWFDGKDIKPRLTDETVRDANLRGYTDFECGLLRDRMDELEQRISDVNDANLYGLSQLEERIDALERRIEKLERKLNHKGGDDGRTD